MRSAQGPVQPEHLQRQSIHIHFGQPVPAPQPPLSKKLPLISYVNIPFSLNHLNYGLNGLKPLV